MRAEPAAGVGATVLRPLEVAIIGAGISGLACARSLADHGHGVRVFERARGVGGRMATRRKGTRHFDHGAQYFTVRDSRFRRWIDECRESGLVARWEGSIAEGSDGDWKLKSGGPERLVAVPGMSSLCRHLAAELEVTFETRVKKLERRGRQWRLVGDDGADLGGCDAAVVSVPAPQAAVLLSAASPEMAARAAEVEMSPCWAAMVSFSQPLELGFAGAFFSRSPLSWVARNGSKPGRPDGEDWVLHASPEWSREHLELDRLDVASRLLAAFESATTSAAPPLQGLDAHRWRFAQPEPLSQECLFDADLLLAASGDWCGGPRVEGAFLSGLAVADRILALASDQS